MSFKKPDLEYWNNKFTAYMHDPIDKVFDIKTHENRAQQLLQKFGLYFPNEEFWKIADGIASGFERGQVPSYSKEEYKSGAIDFLKFPYISHPTSSEKGLKLKLQADLDSEDISRELLEKITKIIDEYSERFRGDEEKFALARFLYTHLVLRFKLAEENVAGLGALWHRIPADSRFPDHSIWQHNQLTSAIYSCMADNINLGLMVFSITPVQGFIAKARKLRDFWSASVLLSYLAFEGIVWIIENLGADHVIYPSLIDQPLIAEYLKNNYKIMDKFSPKLWESHDKTIANFPNKFLILVPFEHIEDIGQKIIEHISKKWNDLVEIILKFIISELKINNDNSKKYLKEIFHRQRKNFWEFNWAGVKLIDKNDFEIIKKLLPENFYKNQFELLEIFNKIIEDKKHFEKSGKGVLYSVSHSLVQSALASAKIKKNIIRDEEPGEKCQMCGEFEVIHTKEYKNDISAKEYSDNIKSFWKELYEKIREFNENERLCSICLIKRLIARALKKDSYEHILNSVFENYEAFPSTTYIALYNYFNRKKIKDEKKKREISQKLFESSLDTIEDVEDRDKYYAILLMDGDKMGELINGKTIASKWETIMHPEIVERLKSPDFDKNFRENWLEIFKNYPKRLLTPSIHSAISEALGDFAIYGVSSIIKKYDGTLIYAGGDDVCAIMPVDTVFDAAKDIQEYYKSSFRIINLDGKSEEVKDEFTPKQGKLSINLGKGDKISISAGILICHHKENLSEMIKRAHFLLDKKAKDEGGRNSCAIELRKRNGGSRFFVVNWNEDEIISAFKNFGKYVKDIENKSFSTSLIYRLETFKTGILAILEKGNLNDLNKFLISQIKRSGVTKNIHEEEIKNIANTVIKLCVKEKNFTTEPLIISSFLAGGKLNDNLV